MRDRLVLLAYLGSVLAVTLVHAPALLAAGIALVLISAGGDLGRLASRVARTVAPYALAVSLGYLVVAGGHPAAAGETLLRLNLRMLLLSGLAIRVLPKVDLRRALGFSATLGFVLGLTTSQVITFRRLFDDFRLGLASRTPRRIGLLAALRHGAATGAWFLRRAEHDAAAKTHALEARGFFIDRD